MTGEQRLPTAAAACISQLVRVRGGRELRALQAPILSLAVGVIFLGYRFVLFVVTLYTT